MPFLFEVYNFGHYPEKAHARVHELEDAGWEPHTVALNFTECSILWQHKASSAKQRKELQAEAAPAAAPVGESGGGREPAEEESSGRKAEDKPGEKSGREHKTGK